MGGGRGSRAGQSNGVPSGSTPRALLSPSLPSSSSDSSMASSRNPQEYGRIDRVRSSTEASMWRSCCWKCWGWRNVPSDQMMRLSQVTAGSLDLECDGSGLGRDRERGLALCGHRHHLTPARLLEVAIGPDHSDELRIRLELPAILAALRRLQQELLASDQVAADRFLLLVVEREEVRAVERRRRLELVDAHDDGGGAPAAIGIDRGLSLDRALNERRAAGAADQEHHGQNQRREALDRPADPARHHH